MKSDKQIEVLAGVASCQRQARRNKWLYLPIALALSVGSLFSGSLALIAIALLYASDVVELLLSSVATRLTQRQEEDRVVLGYGRLEIATELAGCVAVALLSASVIYHGVMRLNSPHLAQGWIIVVLVSVLIGIELLVFSKPAPTSWRRRKIGTSPPLWSDRLAFLLPVLAGGVAILLLGSGRTDTIIAVLLSGALLWFALRGIGEALRSSLLGAPSNLDAADVVQQIISVEGVQDIHHLHFWRLPEQRLAIDAHVVVTVPNWPKAEAIRDHIEAILIHKFGVEHSTLEMETPDRELDSCHVYGT
ncbi:cobalt-zinc-cadmium efflux system protein [Litoreibacter meonggei]|uniref:Cobalt-zinc-cadmium efflux system protein n=2 Tax=Rhodobacterales TaxID=204455 RepID=A0A497VAL7_9RHOB|nr:MULTISPECIES: cation diffusion facilitator family transporter [Rhodobacterales]MDU9006488.1 cation diffusion facilitator family transporter [Sedimentitalea todarodis]RLJ40611.1 cobalt-zinc-cadmium efflux system protein [Litoreibacter meonggei]